MLEEKEIPIKLKVETEVIKREEIVTKSKKWILDK